ncbi:hypothetical protein PUN28_009614 [Cardiocondyla obscurior]|uniref:Uncharacterized protein n=1 Tax=Cardiocondyla obscurior TaxID=286306 RepID=A0AAW2FYP4_9HYME
MFCGTRIKGCRCGGRRWCGSSWGCRYERGWWLEVPSWSSSSPTSSTSTSTSSSPTSTSTSASRRSGGGEGIRKRKATDKYSFF